MTNQTFLPASADSLARLHTAEATGTIVGIMRGDIVESASTLALRLRAAETILDRGHGRSVQAVISVPARQAVALKLAALTDADLLQIAKGRGGSTSEKGSPHTTGTGGGSIPEPTAHAYSHTHKSNELQPYAIGHKHFSSQELSEAEDAEFEETDSYDPCA